MTETLGQRLKARRLALGFTRKDVADKWLSERTIQRLEHNDGVNPSFYSIWSLAGKLNMSLDALAKDVYVR